MVINIIKHLNNFNVYLNFKLNKSLKFVLKKVHMYHTLHVSVFNKVIFIF
uniref:Uncharacterized protein n=1 Tax=viral metagenome TaxID=1070528 RepID=A0A6C0E0Z9_9ZZZZ